MKVTSNVEKILAISCGLVTLWSLSKILDEGMLGVHFKELNFVSLFYQLFELSKLFWK